MSQLDARLVRALTEEFGIPAADLRPDATLEADLHLDSLSVVELQVVLEEALGVSIVVDDPATVRTLADLQAVVADALDRGVPLLPVLRLSSD